MIDLSNEKTTRNWPLRLFRLTAGWPNSEELLSKENQSLQQVETIMHAPTYELARRHIRSQTSPGTDINRKAIKIHTQGIDYVLMIFLSQKISM